MNYFILILNQFSMANCAIGVEGAIDPRIDCCLDIFR